MLPKLETPIYEVKLPSSGLKIKIRPFLVKEEKILLMAAQSKDNFEIINVTKEIIKSCVQDSIVIDDLPFFDIDYLFAALRAKSINETVDINFSCNNYVEGEKCGHIFPVTLDISNSSISKPKELSDIIELGPNVSVKMKYPRYSDVKAIELNENLLDKKMRLIYSSVDYIMNGDTIHSNKDIDEEEFKTFIENLTRAQFDMLEEWVDNFPYFQIEGERICEKCNFHHKIKYKNIDSFFL